MKREEEQLKILLVPVVWLSRTKTIKSQVNFCNNTTKISLSTPKGSYIKAHHIQMESSNHEVKNILIMLQKNVPKYVIILTISIPLKLSEFDERLIRDGIVVWSRRSSGKGVD